MRYFLSLGSNLGNKRKNLKQALSGLGKKGVRILRRSSLYKTEPVGLRNQPWFYNQVAEVSSALSPFELLETIKEIESEMKRMPSSPQGPRLIDIDILLAENSIINTGKLIIPHPRMSLRKFVLIPLCEVSPCTLHPVLKMTVEDLLENSEDTSEVKKLGI